VRGKRNAWPVGSPSGPLLCTKILERYNPLPVFEIGNSLREARLRQGLDLARAEAGTKIRNKYLQALEEENFEILPAETYVKGFLRAYAEYLGLDGQLYVDEFNSRFATSDEPVLSQPSARRSRSRPSESNFVVVALAGIVAVTVLVVVAWQFGTGGDPGATNLDDLLGPPPTNPATTPPEPPPPAAAETTARPKVKPAKLILTAVQGPCWMAVHAGSPTGELLYEGTLEQGQTMRFQKKRLWIQLGAPGNLVAQLNGKPASLPTAESIVVVTAKGIRTVST
jgi:cytoskeleton protein RodZ